MSSIRPAFQETRSPFTVTVVIVLYRIVPERSPAFQSVMGARAAMSSQGGSVQVLLWDNSPGAGNGEGLPDGVHYFADASNSGLAKA